MAVDCCGSREPEQPLVRFLQLTGAASTPRARARSRGRTASRAGELSGVQPRCDQVRSWHPEGLRWSAKALRKGL